MGPLDLHVWTHVAWGGRLSYFDQRGVENFEVDGWTGFKFARKHKLLKGKIKDWVKNHFGEVEKVKNNILKEIHVLDKKDDVE